MEIPEIKTLIETQFRRLLPNDECVDVMIKPDEDWQGEPMLRIIIIYDTKNRKKLLDAGQSLTLGRVVRERMEKAGETRFPHIGYVVKSEAGELNLAA